MNFMVRSSNLVGWTALGTLMFASNSYGIPIATCHPSGSEELSTGPGSHLVARLLQDLKLLLCEAGCCIFGPRLPRLGCISSIYPIDPDRFCPLSCGMCVAFQHISILDLPMMNLMIFPLMIFRSGSSRRNDSIYRSCYFKIWAWWACWMTQS